MNLTLSREAALHQAIAEYLGWIGDPIATLNKAVTTDPGFLLGHTTIAALRCLNGAIGSAAPVQAALSAAALLEDSASPAERLHLSAALAWAEGDITGAATLWETVLHSDPQDILALRLAHDTHFYLGASEKLRDVPLSVLPAYNAADTARGYVLGMAAFGLEETAQYEQAERAGREAVTINPGDTWAIHAVAHVLEMQNRPEEGIAWLRGLEAHWAPATGLAVHQWWHLCLYLLEAGRFSEVLSIYDEKIRAPSASAILDLVDAAALLWRLELVEIDVGPRWQALAPLWAAYGDDHVLAFNDIHIAITLDGANDKPGAALHEFSLRNYVATNHGLNAKISQELALPIIHAMRSFKRGNFARCVDLLSLLRHDLVRIGGSNAQRDLFIQTLGVAAFKSNQPELGTAIAMQRKRIKSGTPRAWARYLPQ